MPTGKLFTTDHYQQKFVFLEPESGLYLAGFRSLESAVTYAGYNGYETADPQSVTMAEIDAVQPGLPATRPSPNSAIPQLAAARPPAPKPDGPPPVTRPIMLRRPPSVPNPNR